MIEIAYAATDDVAAAGKLFEWTWAFVGVLLAAIGYLALNIRANDVRRMDQVDKKIEVLTESHDETRALYHALNLTTTKSAIQLDRLVSHADSEVRTRAEANRLLSDQNKAMQSQNQQIIEAVRLLTAEISKRGEHGGRHGDA